LQQLVLELACDGKLTRRAAEKFPTAALAVIDLPVNQWAEARSGCGKLVELILPKELD
jgi:phosphohistidine phosphatase